MKRYEKLETLLKSVSNIKADFWDTEKSNDIDELVEINGRFDGVLKQLDNIHLTHKEIVTLGLSHNEKFYVSYGGGGYDLTVKMDNIGVVYTLNFNFGIYVNNLVAAGRSFKSLRAIMYAQKTKIVTKINFLNKEV